MSTQKHGHGARRVRGAAPAVGSIGSWRPIIPELLAADIQDGTLPVPSRHNPANDATRYGKTRPDRLRAPPQWLTALDIGDYSLFDSVYAASTRQIPSQFFPEAPMVSQDAAIG